MKHRKLPPLEDERTASAPAPKLKSALKQRSPEPAPRSEAKPVRSAMKKPANSGNETEPSGPSEAPKPIKSAMKKSADPPSPQRSALKTKPQVENIGSGPELEPGLRLSMEMQDPSLWSPKGLCRHYYLLAAQRRDAPKVSKPVRAQGAQGAASQPVESFAEKRPSLFRSRTLESAGRMSKAIVAAEAFQAEDEYEISPLKDYLVAKKPDVDALRAALVALPSAKWLDASLDATPPAMPSPLIHAVAGIQPGLVQLLVEFKADVSKQYQGKSMLKGWIKPNTPLLDCVQNRKARFVGTMLGDRLESIEQLLQPSAPAKETWRPTRAGKGRPSIQMVCSRGIMQHTQGHPSQKYSFSINFSSTTASCIREGVDIKAGDGYAIKAGMKVDATTGQDLEAQLWTEIGILKKLEHEHIIRLFETFEEESCIYMVLELCTGGELFDRLLLAGSFPEKTVMRFACQMASAIQHLHGLGICHRDIQAESFLMADEQLTEESSIKLTDFRMAKEFKGELTTKTGALHYLAPEMLTSKGYGTKVDIWSLGVLVFVMSSGTFPFDSSHELGILSAVGAGSYSFSSESWLNFSEEAKELVRKALVVEPSKRIDAKGFLEQPRMRQAAADGALSISKGGAGRSQAESIRSSLSLLADSLTNDQVTDLRKLCEELDSAQTGMVELGHCRDRIVKMVPESKAAEFTALLSQEHLLKKLNYRLLVGEMLARRCQLRRQAARSVFDYFDIDKNDGISLWEISQALGQETELHEAKDAIVSKEVAAIWKEMRRAFGQREMDETEFTFEEFFSELSAATEVNP